MCGGGPKVDTSGSDFAKSEAIRAREQEDARLARISTGMDQIAGVFSADKIDPIIDARKGALGDFLFTELDQKANTARDDLTFSLARAGQTTSSVANKKKLDLNDIFQTQSAQINSQIAGDASSARSDLGRQRQSIEAALRASGDASAASNAALSTATNFRADTPELNPIGNVFLGLTEGIGAVNNGIRTGQVIRSARRPTTNVRASRTIGG